MKFNTLLKLSQKSGITKYDVCVYVCACARARAYLCIYRCKL